MKNMMVYEHLVEAMVRRSSDNYPKEKRIKASRQAFDGVIRNPFELSNDTINLLTSIDNGEIARLKKKPFYDYSTYEFRIPESNAGGLVLVDDRTQSIVESTPEYDGLDELSPEKLSPVDHILRVTQFVLVGNDIGVFPGCPAFVSISDSNDFVNYRFCEPETTEKLANLLGVCVDETPNLHDDYGPFQATFSMLVRLWALGNHSVFTEHTVPRKRDSIKASKNSGRYICPYKTLRLTSSGKKVIDDRERILDQMRRSPRAHFRRGSFHTYQDKRYKRNPDGSPKIGYHRSTVVGLGPDDPTPEPDRRPTHVIP